jgi:16S rRNA (uracil1498-N3)-methyltransferase
VARLLVTPEELGAGSVVARGSSAHYLRDVLRLRAGDPVVLFDGAGREALATIVEVRRDEVDLWTLDPRVATTASPLRLALVVALAKKDKIDLVIEKATELGVGTILPAVCARSVLELKGERALARLGRWRRVAEAAARQCGRADVPRVEAVRPWAEQLAAAPGHRRLCFYEGGPVGSGRAALSGPPPSSAAVAVGPEGGLTPGEVEGARGLGYEVLSLGPRMLRAETAAIVAATLIQHAWGDLG